MVSGVLGFATDADVRAFFARTCPGIRIDRLVGPLQAVAPILVEFARLAVLWPEAAVPVKEIRATGVWPMNLYAESTPGALTFNPWWVTHPAAWNVWMGGLAKSGWHPKGTGHIRAVVAHEQAHRWYELCGRPVLHSYSSGYGKSGGPNENFAEAGRALMWGEDKRLPAALEFGDQLTLYRRKHPVPVALLGG